MTNVVERLLEWGSTPAAPTDDETRRDRPSGPERTEPSVELCDDERVADRDRRRSR